jgi:3-phytase
VLRKVESIAVDPVAGRLLIADEEVRDVKVYDLDGVFTGTLVGQGLFTAEPEGIVLFACGDGGYWLMTDQLDRRSHFLVFDRRTFAPLGAFHGALTANTDGATLVASPTKVFPAGVFYAVHDDRSVTAFDWRRIAEALALPSCDSVRSSVGP